MRPDDTGRRRLLSICETAQGGVGRYQDCLTALAGHGYDLRVILPDRDAGILAPGADLRTFRRRRRGPAALWHLVRAVLSERRAAPPALYLFNSTLTLLPLAVLRLIGDRTPAVYCAHCWAVRNYAEGSLKARLVQAVEGRLCGFADLVLNVSRGDQRLATRLGYAGRQVTVENAVPDTGPDRPVAGAQRPEDGSLNILFVGRFDRQKGIDILLPAFAQARQAAPHLRLTLVGGPVRGGAVPTLPEGATHHGWAAPGALDAHYSAADLLVVPSRWEGLPLVVPEALRNGTPVYLADRSDMADLVDPGVTGGIFPLTVADLAACFAALDRSRLAAMRPAARASYERRFAIGRFARELAAQFDALTAGTAADERQRHRDG